MKKEKSASSFWAIGITVLLFHISPFILFSQQPADFGRIVIASEPDYPPYCFIDETGSAAGFSVDLFNAAAAAMQIEVDVRTGIWAEIKNDLAEGRIDALPLVGRTPEREGLFDFTIPYLSLYGGIVVREGTDDIESIEDLSGKRVGVMKGDNAEEFLRREERDFSIITATTFSEVLRMLYEGGCDAVVMQRLVGLRLINEGGFSGLKILDEPIYDFRQDFCFAVQEGNKDLLALLNEGLSLVMADGTFRRLHTKWFAALELPSRKIIVGGDHNYPPFEFLDEEGKPAGFTVDLTRAIAREMGLDMEIYLGPWHKIRWMLENGEVDVLQGLHYSAERDKTLDFSVAHTVNNIVAVYRSEGVTNEPEELDELWGKALAVQEGDIMNDYFLENGFESELRLTVTTEEALAELSEGLHDYAFTGRFTAMSLIEKNGWENLEISRAPLLTPEYSYAVKNERRALLSYFNEGLAVLEGSGEYRRIYDKWLGVYKPMPPSPAEKLRYSAYIVIPLILIIAGFLIWTRSLRQLVALRTATLAESVEFSKAIVAFSPVALYGIDMEGRVEIWNESAERIFGWSAEEILGQPLPMVPGDKGEESETLRKQILQEGGFFSKELVRMRKDGTVFPVSLSAAPIMDSRGNIVGIIAAAEDISRRKEAEEEIRRYQEHLEELVEEKTRELNQRIEELERFHDATVEREFRIKELRDEIETLTREKNE